MNFKHYFDENYLDREYIKNHRKNIQVTKQKSNKGKFVMQGGKMLFQRVGPINAQYQDNHRAPETRGVWAFPFPIFDWFFVGSSYSSPAKHSPKVDMVNLDKNIVELTNVDRLFLQKELKKIITSPDYSIYEDDIIDALKTGKIHKGTLNELKFRKERMRHPQFKIKKFFWDGPVYAHFSPKGMIGMSKWYKYENPLDYLKELRKHIFVYMNDHNTDNKLKKIKVDKMGRTGTFSLGADDYEVFIPMK